MPTTTYTTSHKLQQLGCELRGDYGWYESLETGETIPLLHREVNKNTYRFVCEAPELELLLQWLESYCGGEVMLNLSTSEVHVHCPSNNFDARQPRTFHDAEDVGKIIVAMLEKEKFIQEV